MILVGMTFMPVDTDNSMVHGPDVSADVSRSRVHANAKLQRAGARFLPLPHTRWSFRCRALQGIAEHAEREPSRSISNTCCAAGLGASTWSPSRLRWIWRFSVRANADIRGARMLWMQCPKIWPRTTRKSSRSFIPPGLGEHVSCGSCSSERLRLSSLSA